MKLRVSCKLARRGQSLPKGRVVRHSKIARPMTLRVNLNRVDGGGTSIHVRYASNSEQIGRVARNVAKCLTNSGRKLTTAHVVRA